MPPKPQGERALTNAERQARQRQRKAAEQADLKRAMKRVKLAKTLAEAHKIAADYDK